jgi:hypothetical protein
VIGIGMAGLALPAAARAAGGPVPPVQGGAGASAPGSTVTYATIDVDGNTLLERVNKNGGALERTRLLHGSWGVPGVAYDGTTTGLSADGRTLVLAHTIARYPVKSTRLLLVDTRGLRPRAHITLPGFAVVDAVSPDGRWMYLVKYRSPNDLNHYAVRAYDLRARKLLAKPVVDPREPDEKMQGFPLTRTVSADGRWAYTLYQRPVGAPFVHALDTAGRTAACIDLPTLSGIDMSDIRLRLQGTTLSVGSAVAPQALIDTRSFKVRKPPAARTPGVRIARAQQPVADAGGGLPWAPIGLGAALLVALGLAARRRRSESQRERPAAA